MPIDPALLQALHSCPKAPYANPAPDEGLRTVEAGPDGTIHVVIGWSGMGRWMTWTQVDWLIDPKTCRQVGLTVDGGAGSVMELARVDPMPTDAVAGGGRRGQDSAVNI